MAQPTNNQYDVIVIGSGAAGLSAALSAAESLGESGRVLVVERGTPAERGGNTRWTGAYLRLSDPYTPADDFLEDAASFSDGYADLGYWRRMLELLPETMEWLQDRGLRFNRRTVSFLSKSRPRLLPDGGGEAIVRVLGEHADRLGVQTRFETTAVRLQQDDTGRVVGVRLRSRGGAEVNASADAVILAAGGFEGSPRMMAQYYGRDAHKLRPIAPGGLFNKGEGIQMALEIGAKAAGQWDLFHAEPMDPRSSQPAPTMMAFPFGILVNQHGERFTDEGADTVDENYEAVARAIREQPGGIAYLIADQRLWDIPGIDRAINTDLRPITAPTLDELAEQIQVPAETLTKVVMTYNDHVGPGDFRPTDLDGLSTTGLIPRKSNWSRTIDQPPFVAYPMSCAVVFTFGGIGTDHEGRVLSEDGVALPGLYAAGECTGVYFGKYLGATSVLRSLIFGRACGRAAAASAHSTTKIGMAASGRS